MQDRDISAEDIVGTWSLSAFTIDDGSGPRSWRPAAHGLLIYTATGHMSVSINSEQGDGSFLDSVLFYAGTWSVEPTNVIVHRVLNATDPARIGNQMRRLVEWHQGQLRLVAEGSFGRAFLNWVKVP